MRLIILALMLYGSFAVASDDTRPCQIKGNLIDTRDGGVRLLGQFSASLLDSSFLPDNTRPEGCNKIVSSTGKSNPRSIVQTALNSSVRTYSEVISLKEGYISEGALTFRRLVFTQGELDLIARPNPLGYSVQGIWRTTSARLPPSEFFVFPALTSKDFHIDFRKESNGWSLKVQSDGITYPLSGSGTNVLLSVAFGALKEEGTFAGTSHIVFTSEETCTTGGVVTACF